MISTVHLLASNLITTCSSYGLGSSAVIYVLIQLWPSQLKNRREGFPDSGLQSDSGEKRLVMG
jgi:hypothetical protein